MSRPHDRLWRSPAKQTAPVQAASVQTGSVRKVIVFGLFGSGNSGNDASLEAMLTFLRRWPDMDITCVCNAPDTITAKHGIHGMSIGAQMAGNSLLGAIDRMLFGLPRRLTGLVRAVLTARSSDVLIFPGTGILDDFGTGPFSVPLAIFGWCLGARLGGAQIAFVSIGAGPIHHPLSRRLMAGAAAMAQYRSYRDTVSRDFMESIGFDTRRDAVFPDIAFALPIPPSGIRAEQALTVGLGVMGYYGWSHDMEAGAEIHRTYLNKLLTFTLWLLGQGYRVRLLTGDNGDRDAVGALAALVRAALPGLPPERLCAEPTSDLHELMEQIAGTGIVVATRFHNVVAALKLARPVVSIGYASKNDALLADMGLAGFCQHIEELDVDRLIAQFTTLLDARDRHEREIRERVDFYRRRLTEQEGLLAARFHLTPGRSAMAPATLKILDETEQRS
jgi:polysaccharide pyruvyl transferase WcaK-like protein